MARKADGTTTLTATAVTLVQGRTPDGAAFGYVNGDGGGYFFTWRPTLDETLASIEADEAGGGLDAGEVAEYLRAYLPTTIRGQRLWGDYDYGDE